jgi:heme exporter protein C
MGAQSSMDSTMLTTMLIMTFACWAYSIAVSLARVRTIILEREKDSNWVKELIAGKRV